MTGQLLFTAIIEDPTGSYTHMEFNEERQQYEVIHNFKVPWPFHYGYIKGTYVDVDGDPLDLAIFGDFPSSTGQEMQVRIIGAAIIKDGDHKVFAVNPADNQFGNCTEYLQIPEELRTRGENVFARGGHEIYERLSSNDAIAFVKSHGKDS